MAYPQLAAFARLANGDVAAARSIAGQPTMIGRAGHNVEYDAVNDELWHANPEAQAILVFRGGADGEEAPKRIIQGPHTHMSFPNYGLGVDAIHNDAYVVDKAFVLVYPRTANGDTAPIREIRGPDTGLVNARGFVVDPVHNVLFVGTNNGLVIFDRTADGNAKPRAIVSGPLSGIRASKPHSGPLTQADLDARRRGNQGVAISNLRMSPKYLVAVIGGGGRGGDDEEGGGGAAEAERAAPAGGARRSRGPNGGPGGVVAWSIDDLLSVKGKGDILPTYVLTDPKGALGPGRLALNPNQKEVILGGDRIVMYSFPEIF